MSRVCEIIIYLLVVEVSVANGKSNLYACLLPQHAHLLYVEVCYIICTTVSSHCRQLNLLPMNPAPSPPVVCPLGWVNCMIICLYLIVHACTSYLLHIFPPITNLCVSSNLYTLSACSPSYSLYHTVSSRDWSWGRCFHCYNYCCHHHCIGVHL